MARARNNAGVLITRLADHYDSHGKPDHPIRVRSTRSYIMKYFKPVERGGELAVGKHPIVLLPRPQDLE